MNSCSSSSSSKIWLNEEEFIEDVKYQVIARPRISKETSLSKIKAMIQSDYELTSNQQYTKLPVTCPLTTKRLKHPAKYSTCDHPHCFELEAFIRLVQLQSSKRFSYSLCPICEAEVDPGDLAIDELFTCLLHSNDKNGVKDLGGGAVKIYESGEWEWEKKLELDMDDDDENDGKKIEEIELTDSEDDDNNNNYDDMEAQEQQNDDDDDIHEPSVILIEDDDDEVLEIESELPIVNLEDEEDDDLIPLDQVLLQPSSPISPIGVTPSASPPSPPNPFLLRPNVASVNVPPTNARPHICKTCGRGFKELKHLNQHVQAKQSDGHHKIIINNDNSNNDNHNNVTIATKKVIAKPKKKLTPSNPPTKQPLLNKIQPNEGGINRNRNGTMSSTYTRLNHKLSQLRSQLHQQKNQKKVTRLPEPTNSSVSSASTSTSGANQYNYYGPPNPMVNNSQHYHHYYYPPHQQWPMPHGHVVDPNYYYYYNNKHNNYGSGFGMYGGAHYNNYNNEVEYNNAMPSAYPHPNNNNAHYHYTGNYDPNNMTNF